MIVSNSNQLHWLCFLVGRLCFMHIHIYVYAYIYIGAVSISNVSGRLTPIVSIAGSEFSDNVGPNGGGAASLQRVLGFVSITESKFDTNVGGGLWITQNEDGISIVGSYFRKNEFNSNGGGALFIDDVNRFSDEGVTITDTTFYGNTALRGGAIEIINIEQDVIITGSDFKRNTAIESAGGAVALSSVDSVTFTDGKFTRNTAAGNGGAVDVSIVSGDTTIVDNRFLKNGAGGEGGAVYTDVFGGNLTTEPNFLYKNSPNDFFNATADYE